MAFQTVPDGVEVVFTAMQNGVPIVNVFNVQDTETHDAARLGVIADAFKAWWSTNVQASIHESYVLQSIKVTNLTSSAGPQVVRNYTTGNAGGTGGVATAGNAAGVVSWRTGNIGRSFRGRTYFGGLAAGELTNAQFLAAGTVTALSVWGTTLIDAMGAIGCKLAVLSRFAAGVLRVTGLLTEIISVVVDSKVDSQRRRTAN